MTGQLLLTIYLIGMLATFYAPLGMLMLAPSARREIPSCSLALGIAALTWPLLLLYAVGMMLRFIFSNWFTPKHP